MELILSLHNHYLHHPILIALKQHCLLFFFYVIEYPICWIVVIFSYDRIYKTFFYVVNCVASHCMFCLYPIHVGDGELVLFLWFDPIPIGDGESLNFILFVY